MVYRSPLSLSAIFPVGMVVTAPIPSLRAAYFKCFSLLGVPWLDPSQAASFGMGIWDPTLGSP